MDILNNKKLHFHSFNWKREIQCWRNRIGEVQFKWVERAANKVADKLAKGIVHPSSRYVFHSYVPVFITNVLHDDYVKSSY